MLKLSHISKELDGLPVLRDLSLTVSPGEIVALIGPSGCGKTTLLNIISGLIQPDSGTAEGAGERLSYLFQGTRLLPWRTVYENIRLVQEDASPEEIRSLIRAVVMAPPMPVLVVSTSPITTSFQPPLMTISSAD